ncbi:adenine nucleotide alpha hydrolases-like protein, partial [Periconia macrospinosa]
MASSPTNPVPSQGPQYNVVALISGGKDSFFSLLHCLANGHNLVALANLHPPPSAPSEELDSYMYQTVGHRLVPLYEQALGVPLYRCVIRGGTGTGDRDYGTREDDETEDLIPLLKRVLAKHPEVNAICTGAILSTYQRTRIESIALRLRLTPLAFLWQYPSLPPYDQAGLLADMASVGQDSRIVKVASAGLSEHAFLWRNVADHTTIARMKNAMSRFAVNGDGCVLGEGGEYETLTLDGPRVLWKGRVVVEGTDGYVVDGGKEVEGRVVMKSEDEEAKKGFEGLRIPSLWDDEFKRVLQSDALLDSSSSSSSSSDDNEELPSTEQPPLPTSKTFASLPPSTPSLSPSGTIFTYPNITAPPTSSSPTTPESQLTTIFALLSSALATHALPKSQITHCTLLLRHMSTFTSINATYASFFSFTNPPSRATVAIGSLMPEGVDVMLSVIAHRLPSSSSSSSVQREGLHVQSQSYWAPANIGPYSQAISVPL